MTSWPAAALALIDHWQTLIAGLLAVAAAVWTVRATVASANREIEASQAQTKVAQDQIAVTQRIERRRIAREEYAFSAMLSAAMGCVVQDVVAARDIASTVKDDTGRSERAFQARHRIRKIGFDELRTACLTYGGQLTKPFLELEKEIDDLCAPSKQLMEGGVNLAVHFGLHVQLARIEDQARTVDSAATKGMARCWDVLTEAPEAPEAP
jgi:hypothetical protein